MKFNASPTVMPRFYAARRNSAAMVAVKSLFATLREFAKSIAMAVRQLLEQLQREIEDERNRR